MIHYILFSPMQFYDGGVFDSFWCSSTNVNHAMTLIGYGTYNGKQYWMVKNRYNYSIIITGAPLSLSV